MVINFYKICIHTFYHVTILQNLTDKMAKNEQFISTTIKRYRAGRNYFIQALKYKLLWGVKSMKTTDWVGIRYTSLNARHKR